MTTLPTPYYSRDGITIYHSDWREVLPVIDQISIELVLTDPPYGDDHDTDYTRFSGGRRRRDGSELTRYTYTAVHDDDQDFDPSPLLSIGKRQVIFGANRFSDDLPCGSWLVWDKRTATGSKGVMSDAEVAWFSHGRGVYLFNHTWDGFNRASERGDILHPTQKPVALMRWIVERWSKPDDLIFDPYMGSGPIARACRDTRRRYIGCDVVETYCATTVKRLQQSVMQFDEPATRANRLTEVA